jgi:hypothetical protein
MGAKFLEDQHRLDPIPGKEAGTGVVGLAAFFSHFRGFGSFPFSSLFLSSCR